MSNVPVERQLWYTSLTPEEQKYIRHFSAAVAGEYNALAWRIPPRIKANMQDALRNDDFMRQMDEQCEQLNRMIER